MKFLAISAILATVLLAWAWTSWTASPSDWRVRDPVPPSQIVVLVSEVDALFGGFSRETRLALWRVMERLLVLSQTLRICTVDHRSGAVPRSRVG